MDKVEVFVGIVNDLVGKQLRGEEVGSSDNT
jgi:hypothetical protein